MSQDSINSQKEDSIKEELLAQFKEYLDSQEELCEDNIAMIKILPKLLKLQNDKGRVYGRSYAKHGDTSIFLNVERKFDRISVIMDKAMKEGTDTLYSGSSDTSTPTETFMDTVVDLGLYGLMWASHIATEHPEVYNQFLLLNKL